MPNGTHWTPADVARTKADEAMRAAESLAREVDRIKKLLEHKGIFTHEEASWR